MSSISSSAVKRSALGWNVGSGCDDNIFAYDGIGKGLLVVSDLVVGYGLDGPAVIREGTFGFDKPRILCTFDDDFW